MDKLYHYTLKEARDGICDGNTLWFKLTSKSRNDDRDTTYIREVLNKAIEQYKGDNYFFRKAFKVMNSVLNPVAPENEKCYIEKNIFMFCVMRIQNDEAGQEFYGKDSEVYRIEFDKQALIDYFTNLIPSIENYGLFIFGDMIYDERQQINRICDIIRKYENDYIEFNKNNVQDPIFLNKPILAATPLNDYSGISGYQPALNESHKWYAKSWGEMEEKEKLFLDKLWISLANEFYKISTFIKDPSFEEKEKEYRIAFYGKPNYEKHKPINEFNCIQFPIDKSVILNDTLVSKEENVYELVYDQG